MSESRSIVPKFLHVPGRRVHHDLMPNGQDTACGLPRATTDEISEDPDRDWPDFPQCKICYRAVG